MCPDLETEGMAIRRCWRPVKVRCLSTASRPVERRIWRLSIRVKPFFADSFPSLASIRPLPLNVGLFRDCSRIATLGAWVARLPSLVRDQQICLQQLPPRFGLRVARHRMIAGPGLSVPASLHRMHPAPCHFATLDRRLPNTSPGSRLASITLIASNVAMTPIAALDGGTPIRPSHTK